MGNVSASIRRRGNTRQLQGSLLTGVAVGMRAGAEAILNDSQENYVPVDTGALRDSGRVEGPEILGDIVTVRVVYGGNDVDYAVVVHENPYPHHPHGSFKYLEIPGMNGAPIVLELVRSSVRSALG